MTNNKQEPNKGMTESIHHWMDVRRKPKNGMHKRGKIPLINGLNVNHFTSEIQLE